MECQTIGMFENWRDKVRDRTEQQGTWSGPEGGPQCAGLVAHDITEGNH